MRIILVEYLRQLLLSLSMLSCEGQAHDVAGLAGLIRGAADDDDDDPGEDDDDSIDDDYRR